MNINLLQLMDKRFLHLNPINLILLPNVTNTVRYSVFFLIRLFLIDDTLKLLLR